MRKTTKGIVWFSSLTHGLAGKAGSAPVTLGKALNLSEPVSSSLTLSPRLW